LNIPPAIGNILGTIWGGPIVDWYIVKLSQKNGGIYEPEMRLALFPLPGILMPIGVFMFGLSTAKVCFSGSDLSEYSNFGRAITGLFHALVVGL
jgi:hypothetical protein